MTPGDPWVLLNLFLQQYILNGHYPLNLVFQDSNKNNQKSLFCYFSNASKKVSKKSPKTLRRPQKWRGRATWGSGRLGLAIFDPKSFQKVFKKSPGRVL